MIFTVNCVCAAGFVLLLSLPFVHSTGHDSGCLAGFWGDDCEHFCGQCSNKTCERDTGNCLSACLPGFLGDDCGMPCANFSHGLACTEVCGYCYGNASCDPESGHCPAWCEAGWYGFDCKAPCPTGLYEFNCESHCGGCFDGTCDPVTGGCSLRGCTENFVGIRCKDCKAGKHGPACSKDCGKCLGGSACNPDTGECVLGCEKGYLSPTCVDESDERAKIIIIGTLGGTVGLIVVLLVFFLFKLQSKNVTKDDEAGDEDDDEREDVGNPDNSEYAKDGTAFGMPTTEAKNDEVSRAEMANPIFVTTTQPAP